MSIRDSARTDFSSHQMFAHSADPLYYLSAFFVIASFASTASSGVARYSIALAIKNLHAPDILNAGYRCIQNQGVWLGKAGRVEGLTTFMLSQSQSSTPIRPDLITYTPRSILRLFTNVPHP